MFNCCVEARFFKTYKSKKLLIYTWNGCIKHLINKKNFNLNVLDYKRYLFITKFKICSWRVKHEDKKRDIEKLKF